jgi:hypothetical protein
MKKLTPLFSTLLLTLGMSVPAMAQNMGSFENFLNSHPNTARELQQNPNLINNPSWMGHHQGLEEYMAAHPDIRAEVHQNPGAIMNNGGRWSWNNPGNPAANRFENGYLDEHPDVAHQLAAHPGLADNPQYLAAHPGLQGYLNAHPNVHSDLEHHPNRFMSDADYHGGNPGTYPGGYHGAPPAPGYGYGSPGWDANHPHALGSADNYFDHHQDVYHEMEQDPRLVDNQHYVDSHPGLHSYLEEHPHARETFKQHPDAFMHAEEHYDKNHPHH